MPIRNLNPTLFLQQYWQKKPLLIRGAWRNFSDPVTPEELAGLSLEEEVDSRLILSQPEWQQISGPLDETIFQKLPESDWTLLVQSVETWIPELRAILSEFQFIPNWRLDDLMVSYAVPGGTVGSHIDQYDVFLLQGQGKRHWQVGQPNQTVTEHLPHPLIKQVKPFTPTIDEVLEPGDLLYIPPNTPHNGVATENCLTYSIGFRAPSQHNLLEQLLIDLVDQDESLSDRYQDPLTSLVKASQTLPKDVINWSRNALNSVSDQQLLSSFGQSVTRLKHDMIIEADFSAEAFQQQVLSTECQLICHPGSRLTCYPFDEKLLLFINGDCFPLHTKHSDWATILCEEHLISNYYLKKHVQDVDFASTIAILVKKGWLIINQ